MESKVGLSSYESLSIIRKELEIFLEEKGSLVYCRRRYTVKDFIAINRDLLLNFIVMVVVFLAGCADKGFAWILRQECCIMFFALLTVSALYIVVAFKKFLFRRNGLYYNINRWLNFVLVGTYMRERFKSGVGKGSAGTKMDFYPDLGIPFSNSSGLVRAVRDGCIIWCPVSFLVRGDLIILSSGELIDGRLRLEKIYDNNPLKVEFEQRILLGKLQFQKLYRVMETRLITILEDFIVAKFFSKHGQGGSDSREEYYGYASTNVLLVPRQQYGAKSSKHTSRDVEKGDNITRVYNEEEIPIFDRNMNQYFNVRFFGNELASSISLPILSLFFVVVVYLINATLSRKESPYFPVSGWIGSEFSLEHCFVVLQFILFSGFFYTKKPFFLLLCEIVESYSDAKLSQLWETLQVSKKPFLESGQIQEDVDSLKDNECWEKPNTYSDIERHVSNESSENDLEMSEDKDDIESMTSNEFSTSDDDSISELDDETDDEEIYDNDDFDDEASPPKKQVKLSSFNILGKFFIRLFNMRSNKPISMFRELSNLTVLIMSQTKGISFRPFPVPEHIVILCNAKGDECSTEIPEVDGKVDTTDGSAETSGVNMTILDILPNRQSNSIVFEDGDWKKHFSSLQPLGFCISHTHLVQMYSSFLSYLSSGIYGSQSGSCHGISGCISEEKDLSVMNSVRIDRSYCGRKKVERNLQLFYEWILNEKTYCEQEPHLSYHEYRNKNYLKGVSSSLNPLRYNSSNARNTAYNVTKNCPYHHLFDEVHMTCFCNLGVSISGSALFKNIYRINTQNVSGDRRPEYRFVSQAIGWNVDSVVGKRSIGSDIKRSGKGGLEDRKSSERDLSRKDKLRKYIQFQIAYDGNSKHLIIVGEGDSMNLVRCCSEYWSGGSIFPMTEAVINQIVDFIEDEERNHIRTLLYSLHVYGDKEFHGVFQKKTDVSISHLVEKSVIPSCFWVIFDDEKGFSFFMKEYVPIPKSSETYDLLLSMITNNTFMGMVGMGDLPNENMCECIDDFSQAGIRFVYFSCKDERWTKNVGDRLGLETDWNSCITLKQPFVNDLNVNTRSEEEPCAFEAGSASRLPENMQTMRRHLVDVDDVPLHVSLFSDATLNDMFEMIKIYKEAGEVVGYWGCSGSEKDIALYCDVDFGISSEVFHNRSDLSDDAYYEKKINIRDLATSFHCTITDSLRLDYNMSPYLLTQMIQESRSLRLSFNNFIDFCVSSSLAVFAIQMLSLAATGYPGIVSPCSWVWLNFLIIPAVGASLLKSSDGDMMKCLPEKQNRVFSEDTRSTILKKARDNKNNGRFMSDTLVKKKIIGFSRLGYVREAVKRWIVPIISTIVVYYLVLYNINCTLLHDDARCNIFVSSDVSEMVEFSRSVAICVLVLLVVTTSVFYTHPIFTLRHFNPLVENKYWMTISVLVVLSQITYFVLSLRSLQNARLYAEMGISLVFWIVVVISMVVVIVHQEFFIKRKLHCRFILSQKRAKLEFNTKLGMHSPI